MESIQSVKETLNICTTTQELHDAEAILCEALKGKWAVQSVGLLGKLLMFDSVDVADTDDGQMEKVFCHFLVEFTIS